MTYDFQYISEDLKRMIEPATRLSHFFEAQLGTRVFEDAWVAPYLHWDNSIGGVIGRDGAAVKDSECLEWKEDSAYYDTTDSLREHKRVIFLGFLLVGFGHAYTDDLRKLWFLKTDECKALVQEGYELVYTTSWNRPIPPAVWEVFQLAGLDLGGARHITRLTRFDTVVVPDNCFKAADTGRIYCKEFADLIGCINAAVPDRDMGVPRVYFSRSHYMAGQSKERGEKDIERVFQKLGYQIVFPEEHSVSEQIQLVRNCDHFAATEGSIAHLSLFCRPDTDVVIINKANYLNFHQITINELAGLNVTYIEAHHSLRANPDHPWWGPFYLCVTRYLERFVQQPIPRLPYWIRFSYWAYSRNILFKVYNRSRKILGL